VGFSKLSKHETICHLHRVLIKLFENVKVCLSSRSCTWCLTIFWKNTV